MTIQSGDTIPETTLKRIREGVETVDTPTLFEGHKVLLFAVPGAFTPTCSERHLPGYVEHYEKFHERGIDVYCLSVNDPFVMQAWGRSQNVPDGLQMLADGNADFTRAMGLEMDSSASAWACAPSVTRWRRRRHRQTALVSPGRIQGFRSPIRAGKPAGLKQPPN